MEGKRIKPWEYNQVIPADPDTHDKLLEEHLKHMDECDKEEKNEPVFFKKIKKKINKINKKIDDFSEKHRRISAALECAAVAGTGALIVFSSAHGLFHDNNTNETYFPDYIGTDHSVDISTEHASHSGLSLEELDLVNITTHKGICLNSTTETDLGDTIDKTIMPDAQSVRGDLICSKRSVSYCINMNGIPNFELNETIAKSLLEKIGYSELERVNSTQAGSMKFTSKDGCIGFLMNEYPSSDSKKDLIVHIELSRLNMQELKDNLKMMYNNSMVPKVLIDPGMAILSHVLRETTPEEEKMIPGVKELLDNATFMRYWELPTGKATADAAKNLTKATDINEPRLTYERNQKDFGEWLNKTGNSDTIKNGSLTEVLETIEKFTSESYSYKKEGKPTDFVCTDYTVAYISAFNDAKRMNPDLENVYATAARSSRGLNEIEGHAYVKLVSVVGNKMYVSFVDPTYSDDDGRAKLDKNEFDAWDKEHYITMLSDAVPKDAKVDYNEHIDTHENDYTNLIRKSIAYTAGMLGYITTKFMDFMKAKKVKKASLAG
ncbi:MAG: hypothetical protein PHC66_02875 [Candidatus Nanoarchaeia archaeon]|nr:hypothetical protein [Candidatus Nanoarchaeia archaeon]MDD5239006.1 hypothetical protein [Candidatus Nanoarchaeia archaeon]